MAKKRPQDDMPETAETKTTHQAKLELPIAEFERVRKAAQRRGLSISAFLRMAVLKETERVEEGRD